MVFRQLVTVPARNKQYRFLGTAAMFLYFYCRLSWNTFFLVQQSSLSLCFTYTYVWRTYKVPVPYLPTYTTLLFIFYSIISSSPGFSLRTSWPPAASLPKPSRNSGNNINICREAVLLTFQFSSIIYYAWKKLLHEENVFANMWQNLCCSGRSCCGFLCWWWRPNRRKQRRSSSGRSAAATWSGSPWSPLERIIPRWVDGGRKVGICS